MGKRRQKKEKKDRYEVKYSMFSIVNFYLLLVIINFIFG